MRGVPKYNYPAFMAADALLTAAGWDTFNPAKMDIEEDAEDYAAFSESKQKLHDIAANSRRFAARDTDVLIHSLRAEDGDAIVVLPSWETSIGARAEVAVAIWVMLPMYTLDEALYVAKRSREA
jgi:hypothetical protein